MNTHEKNAAFEEAMQALPGLGYFNDDIQAQLKETAKSISQDVVDLLSSQYRDARQPMGGMATLPEALWQPLRGKAYSVAADHCEALVKEIREAAKNPNMSL